MKGSGRRGVGQRLVCFSIAILTASRNRKSHAQVERHPWLLTIWLFKFRFLVYDSLREGRRTQHRDRVFLTPLFRSLSRSHTHTTNMHAA